MVNTSESSGLPHAVRCAVEDWQKSTAVPRRLTVRWMINPGEVPRDFITLEANRTHLTAVRSASAGEASTSLPVILMPRFINAHTHLEFSGLTTPLETRGPFSGWIESVIHYRNQSLAMRDVAWRQGTQEAVAGGARVVCDIETQPAVWNDVPESLEHAFVLREFIGLNKSLTHAQLDEADRLLRTASPDRLQRGLSPHAPYSVHPELLSGLVDVAVRHRAVMAMHVAETTAEIELLRSGRGELADFLKRRDLFESSTFPGGRSVREILEMLARCHSALVVHANYLTNDEVAFLAGHPQLTVVWCPRTHAGFRHPPHPIRRLLAAGVRIAIGTDSRASNPDLSMWSELQFAARQLPDVPIEHLLRLVTTEPAQALGLKADSFRIEPGAPISGLQWAAIAPECSPGETLLTTAFHVNPLQQTASGDSPPRESESTEPARN